MHTRKGIDNRRPSIRRDRIEQCHRPMQTDRALNLPVGPLQCQVTELIKVTYCTIRLHLNDLHSQKPTKEGGEQLGL